MSYARTNPSRQVGGASQPRQVGGASQPRQVGGASEPWKVSGASQSYHPGPASSAAASAPSRELQHHGAYAVKAPDLTKRDKIKRVAHAETQAYEQYKQNRRNNVQYVTTNASVGAIPRRQPNPFEGLSGQGQGSRQGVTRNPGAPKLKPPSLRSQSLRMEDPEIERRKAVQRQKAEALQNRQNDRQQRMDNDRQRKNCQFLDRLEGKR